MSSDIAIKVENLGKCFQIYDRPHDRLKQMLLGTRKQYYREFWALKNVSFEIPKGKTVGIIGRNGSGKSTLLQLICGTLNPTDGKLETNGRIAALLELGAGFNHEFTGRENVFLNASLLGLTEKEILAQYQAIVDFSGIEDSLDQPVKTYSSGMVVRLAFAIAIHTNPEILIVDEALAVGDMVFQARCLDRIQEMKSAGVTTFFVTHDIGTFQAICDFGLLLDQGMLKSQGEPRKLAAEYYSIAQEHEYQRQRKITKSSELVDDNSSKNVVQRILPDEKDSIEFSFGSKEANIESYCIFDANGLASSTITAGENFRIEINVAINKPIFDLTAAVMFRNPQGQNLFGANTRYDSDIRLKSISTGTKLKISMKMDMLLNPGQYLLHIGLSDCTSDHLYVTLDNRDQVEIITVVGKPVSYGLVHHHPDFKIEYLTSDLVIQ